MQHSEERAGKLAARVDRHAPRDVPHRDPDEQSRARAADGKTRVPQGAPAWRGMFATKLDGDRAEDERTQQRHEREVEAGEHRGVNGRKRREQRAAAGDEPDLVAIPDRPDGVEKDAPLLVAPRDPKVQHADAEIETVEDHVAREECAHEDEPRGVEIERAEVHAAPPAAGFWPSASLPVGVRSASSGP